MFSARPGSPKSLPPAARRGQARPPQEVPGADSSSGCGCSLWSHVCSTPLPVLTGHLLVKLNTHTHILSHSLSYEYFFPVWGLFIFLMVLAVCKSCSSDRAHGFWHGWIWAALQPRALSPRRASAVSVQGLRPWPHPCGHPIPQFLAQTSLTGFGPC